MRRSQWLKKRIKFLKSEFFRDFLTKKIPPIRVLYASQRFAYNYVILKPYGCNFVTPQKIKKNKKNIFNKAGKKTMKFFCSELISKRNRVLSR